jgi:hypothetical protein
MDEEEYEISAEDAHDYFNHRIIVPLDRRIISFVSEIKFFDDWPGFTLTVEFTTLTGMEHKLQPEWECGFIGTCRHCMGKSTSSSTPFFSLVGFAFPLFTVLLGYTYLKSLSLRASGLSQHDSHPLFSSQHLQSLTFLQQSA